MEKAKKSNWYKDAIFYQIYPRSFCDSNGDGLGDIKGIISKIPYLASLGVNAIWLSPIYDSPQCDNGYDISNYLDVYPPFGTLEDAKEMFKVFHEHGIRVITDLVVNHTSDKHAWFQDVLRDPEHSKYRDYYILRKGENNGEVPPNKWAGFFQEPCWTRIPNSPYYYFHIFASSQPDLNWENPAVREEVKKILKFWLDLGADGFRCDVINLISKDYSRMNKSYLDFIMSKFAAVINGPRLHEFLKELNDDVLDYYDCMTVGETVFGDLETANELVNPDNHELTMIFNMDHINVDNYFGGKWYPRKFKVKRLRKVINKWQYGLKYGRNSLFLENHDQRRSVGRFGTDDKEYREVSAKMLATFYFLLRGTPFIYEGQEIGMTNSDITRIEDIKDIDAINTYKNIDNHIFILRKLIKKCFFSTNRDNARTPMQWDDSKYAGFSSVEPWIKLNANKDFINVEAELKKESGILSYYKELIKLRKDSEVIRHGKYHSLLNSSNKIFAYSRTLDNQEIVIFCNFMKNEVKVPKLADYSNYELILSNYEKNDLVLLKPFECRVYKKN